MASRPVQFEKERGVTEVQVARGIAHFVVRCPEGPGAPESAWRLSLLKELADGGAALFLVKIHPGAVSFGVRDADGIARAEKVLAGRGEAFTALHDLALLSVVAGAMRDLSGVMAAIYEALVGQGVVVQQTADAYNAVHLLVPGADADRGQRALCERFAVAPADEAEPDAGAEGVGLKPL
jgi:aspartokinase